MKRTDNRAADQPRPVEIQPGYLVSAEGSALISTGHTKVICTASIEEGVPRFRQGSGLGWVTAEYAMLPRATSTRTQREVNRGRPSGRTSEIQRLIGRALRAAVDFKKLGERSIYIDCDVIQADGGTRTASITGACVALADAMRVAGIQQAFSGLVASVSVGIWRGVPVLDLDYAEDSSADTDMNVVRVASGGFIEIQGTAESEPFDDEGLTGMLALARQGTDELLAAQRAALAAD